MRVIDMGHAARFGGLVPWTERSFFLCLILDCTCTCWWALFFVSFFPFIIFTYLVLSFSHVEFGVFLLITNQNVLVLFLSLSVIPPLPLSAVSGYIPIVIMIIIQ